MSHVFTCLIKFLGSICDNNAIFAHLGFSRNFFLWTVSLLSPIIFFLVIVSKHTLKAFWASMLYLLVHGHLLLLFHDLQIWRFNFLFHPCCHMNLDASYYGIFDFFFYSIVYMDQCNKSVHPLVHSIYSIACQSSRTRKCYMTSYHLCIQKHNLKTNKLHILFQFIKF